MSKMSAVGVVPCVLAKYNEPDILQLGSSLGSFSRWNNPRYEASPFGKPPAEVVDLVLRK